ncbi:MAG: hypothetical protein K5910_08560 [Bacteroidales bacterium]|nr:hypothetical protein [Bacteroidales bacterium]
MKLNDLKDLKCIRKDLGPEAREPAAGQTRPRSKTVVHRSREEERARSEGLVKGQWVRMMDTNDSARIVGFGDGYYELDLDGLVIRAVRSEFLPVNPEDDRKLRASIPSKRSKILEEGTRQEDPSAQLTVDLHMEKIPGSDGVPDWAALDYQMGYFRQVLRRNLKYKGKRIVFVHGVGDGVLAAAIRKELDEAFALSCSYTPGPMGVTNVTIR